MPFFIPKLYLNLDTEPPTLYVNLVGVWTPVDNDDATLLLRLAADDQTLTRKQLEYIFHKYPETSTFLSAVKEIE